MIEDATAGRASSSAAHCAAKSAGPASPAVASTGGPHCARNARVAASAAASRSGGGSGTHRLTCAGPSLPWRNACIQVPMSAAEDSTAPIAPMPPACATATDNGTGQVPAIGDSRIGRRRAKRVQNAVTRWCSESFMAGRCRGGGVADGAADDASFCAAAAGCGKQGARGVKAALGTGDEVASPPPHTLASPCMARWLFLLPSGPWPPFRVKVPRRGGCGYGASCAQTPRDAFPPAPPPTPLPGERGYFPSAVRGLSGTAGRRGRPCRPSCLSCRASGPSCRHRPSSTSSSPSAGTASSAC